MFVIRFKNIIFSVTALYIGAVILALSLWGLQLSIDFTGGSILEVRFPEGRPEKSFVEETVGKIVQGGFILNTVGEDSLSIKMPYIEDEQRARIVESLSSYGGVVEERFNAIDPVVGEELKRKAVISLALVAVAIILFIAFAFRKVSRPVSSWIYGLIAIIALAHDVLVPIGIFSFLGKFAGVEVDALFIAALLAIWGYSVSDTIVVFDRIREHLRINQEKGVRQSFSEVVGQSLKETYARSINTSLTTFLALLALYIFGGVATKLFALALIVGVIAGTYSSIFLASPLLVVWNDWRAKRKGV